METSDSNSRYGNHTVVSRFIQAPLTALLEYSVLLISPGSSSSSQETDGLIAPSTASLYSFQSSSDDRYHEPSSPASPREEVSIRIIDAGEQEREAISLDNDRSSSEPVSEAPAFVGTSSGNESTSRVPAVNSGRPTANGEPVNGGGVNNMDSFFQGYEFQQFTWEFIRRIREILPFSLLLLVVFIRLHLQGFFITIWIAAVMFKSNDILKTQKALKGERKLSVLACCTAVLMLHVRYAYWWYGNSDLLYPLFLLPPKAIPPLGHAIFIIMVYGSDANSSWVSIAVVLCLAAYASLVSILFEQRIWKPFFFIDYNIVFNL